MDSLYIDPQTLLKNTVMYESINNPSIIAITMDMITA